MYYGIAALCGVGTAFVLYLTWMMSTDVVAVIIVGVAILAAFIGIGIAAILDVIALMETEDKEQKS